MPESAAGKTILQRDLHAVRAEAERALAQRLRHRGHRVLGDRGDRRQHEQAHDQARRERVEHAHLDAEPLQDRRREERQGEVAEDDRRDAGEQLEHRLDRPCARAAARTRTGRSRHSRPSGTATTSAINDMYSVPHSSGSTPNEACSPANVGDHLVPNRKSVTGTSPKNDSVSNSSEPTMQTVVTHRQQRGGDERDLDAGLEARARRGGPGEPDPRGEGRVSHRARRRPPACRPRSWTRRPGRPSSGRSWTPWRSRRSC